jgi:hypothetical protein
VAKGSTDMRLPTLLHWVSVVLTFSYAAYAAFWGTAFALVRLQWAPDTPFWNGLASFVGQVPVWQDFAYNFAVILMLTAGGLLLNKHRAALPVFGAATIIERLDWAFLPLSVVGYEANLGYGEMAIEATILLLISLSQYVVPPAKTQDSASD